VAPPHRNIRLRAPASSAVFYHDANGDGHVKVDRRPEFSMHICSEISRLWRGDVRRKLDWIDRDKFTVGSTCCSSDTGERSGDPSGLSFSG
jgi:hypothetical protein